MTPSTSTAPVPVSPAQPASTEPTHGCQRCGAPVGIEVGLCERCNPLGLRDVSASQVHGTVFIGVVLAIVLLALVARLAVTGIGPFASTLDAVVPVAQGLQVTLTVTNEGSSAGQTTCRVTTASNQGGGPSAFMLSPNLQPGETSTFSQLVTELGTTDTDLIVDCRTP